MISQVVGGESRLNLDNRRYTPSVCQLPRRRVQGLSLYPRGSAARGRNQGVCGGSYTMTAWP
jgi:hypothetical protein